MLSMWFNIYAGIRVIHVVKGVPGKEFATMNDFLESVQNQTIYDSAGYIPHYKTQRRGIEIKYDWFVAFQLCAGRLDYH